MSDETEIKEFEVALQAFEKARDAVRLNDKDKEPMTEAVLIPVEDARMLDAIVHKLGIEDSHDDPCEAIDERIRDFARAILHGDNIHKEWLLEAAEAFIHGEPMPPPRDAKASP